MPEADLLVFADVDTGVDDAMALVYLLASTHVELVGIASTGGNVAVDQVCRNNLGLLHLCKAADIPVSRGAGQPLHAALPTGSAHGPAGLGYATLPPTDRSLTRYDAATAWVQAAREHPGRLVGLVTGPLTNLALAVRAEPALPTLLRRLVVMGGAYDYRGNAAPVTEWNIGVDPEAAAEVLLAFTAAAQPPILCGLDLTGQVAMTPAHFERLAEVAGSSTNPLIRMLEDAMRFYFEVHNACGHGYLAHMHDPLAAAVAVDPTLITTRTATVDVELTGTLTRGMTVVDWSGQWGRTPNAQIGVGVDATVFFDRLTQRVGAFARRLD